MNVSPPSGTGMSPTGRPEGESAPKRVGAEGGPASPPRVDIPRDYNAAHDLIERNLAAGRADKIAYVDDAGTYTLRRARDAASTAARTRCADSGSRRSSACSLCLLDTIDFPSVFLGAIKAGIVPVAANTLLTTSDYEYMLRDSRARALVVSAALLPAFAPLLGRLPHLAHVIVSGGRRRGRTSRSPR